jgi:(S)-3,5-dihydroxyphenylglycine transaminase
MNDVERINAEVLGSSRLEVMNFLNEVAGNYPRAISFASGRPAEEFFLVDQWLDKIQDFISYYARNKSIDRQGALNLLAQYGRTNGIISDLIARQVGVDEQIVCEGDQIIATAGCQEAIALCLTALCPDSRDVVIVRSPTYIGLTGVADLHNIPLAPVVCKDPDDFPQALRSEVSRLRSIGKCPRALYIVPDFDNPTGTVLSLKARQQLLDYCAGERIVILEDNPYGMFCYEGERLPPLAALDRHGSTIYLGTYSKTLCPALRVGFIILPRQLLGHARNSQQLSGRISIAKSFITCNTSQFMQALVGGVLLSEQGSLARIVQPALNQYRRNLHAMAGALQTTLGGFGDAVKWNQPSGGFFLTIDLPFEFKQDDVARCASEYQAIVMPLSFFALTDDHDRSVRLAFSNLSPERIEIGISRFADYVKTRL